MTLIKFGKVHKIESLGFRGESRNRREWLLVQCDCGKTFETLATNFNRGKVTSCGCYRTRGRTHGLTGTRVHNIHKGMLSRCNNPNNHAYRHYGGKGVKVCDGWIGAEGLTKFVEDMGEPPSEEHTIERVDNSSGYTKENCRWATQAEQTRNTSQTVFLEYRGKRMCISEWASELRIGRTVISSRLQRGVDYRKNSNHSKVNILEQAQVEET